MLHYVKLKKKDNFAISKQLPIYNVRIQKLSLSLRSVIRVFMLEWILCNVIFYTHTNSGPSPQGRGCLTGPRRDLNPTSQFSYPDAAPAGSFRALLLPF